MFYQQWQKLGAKVPATSSYSDKLLDYLAPGKVVLDTGCGYGRISELIKSKGCVVYGIDINAAAISAAKANPKLAGINFSVQDAAHTNFQDNFFDVIVSQAVLACMEMESRQQVLAEVYRILKQDGIFSISEFGIKNNDEERYIKDALITKEYGTVIVRDNEGREKFRSHNFKEEELSELLTGAGFKIVSYENPDFTTVKGKLHPGHIFICSK